MNTDILQVENNTSFVIKQPGNIPSILLFMYSFNMQLHKQGQPETATINDSSTKGQSHSVSHISYKY